MKKIDNNNNKKTRLDWRKIKEEVERMGENNRGWESSQWSKEYGKLVEKKIILAGKAV